MLISPEGNLIVFNKKDTFILVKRKAYSGIIHEITHYLQQTEDLNYKLPTKQGDEVDDFKSPPQMEAYFVQAYYFLYFHSKAILNKVLKLNIPIVSKRKKLVNECYKIVYPNRAKPYPEE